MQLERATPASTHWAMRHLAGLVSLGLGLCSLAVALVVVLRTSRLFDQMPDWRFTVPLLVGAIIAATASGVRREGHYGLAVGGVALASAAVALGWVLVLVAVAAVALVVIYVLSEVF